MIATAVVALYVGGASQQPNDAASQLNDQPADAIGDGGMGPIPPPQSHAAIQDGGCNEGQDDRDSDLCAQWKAADAARSSADASWILGTISMIVGVLTLIAAFGAARWAKSAASHAGSSALIAKNALIAETRAWLAIKSVAVEAVGDTRDDDSKTLVSYVTVWVHNYGRGPALDCVASVGWRRRGGFWESIEDAPYCRSAQFDILMPDEANSAIRLRLDDPVAEIFKDSVLMLWVDVSYRIVGAEGRRSTTQQLNVGGVAPHGPAPIGRGYLVRGHKLMASPAKTTMV